MSAWRWWRWVYKWISGCGVEGWPRKAQKMPGFEVVYEWVRCGREGELYLIFLTFFSLSPFFLLYFLSFSLFFSKVSILVHEWSFESLVFFFIFLFSLFFSIFSIHIFFFIKWGVNGRTFFTSFLFLSFFTIFSSPFCYLPTFFFAHVSRLVDGWVRLGRENLPACSLLFSLSSLFLSTFWVLFFQTFPEWGMNE